MNISIELQIQKRKIEYKNNENNTKAKGEISMDFTGKNIIVTGGASGIGKAIVTGVVEGGGHAIIVDLNLDAAEKLREELGKDKTSADKPFLQLSSGEQRLALLARAFVKDPELLILDEPLHGLDTYNRRRVKKIIEAFCHRRDKTMIMVTHYENELPQTITNRLFLKRNR